MWEISFKNYNSWEDTYTVYVERNIEVNLDLIKITSTNLMNYRINENNLWNGYESLKLNMKNGMESLLVFS